MVVVVLRVVLVVLLVLLLVVVMAARPGALRLRSLTTAARICGERVRSGDATAGGAWPLHALVRSRASRCRG